jgi:hypothetical protein
MPTGKPRAEVLIPVECGGALHRVVVTNERVRSVRIATPDHPNADAESVLMALGAPVPPCFEVPASIDKLRRSGLAGMQAARWIAVAGEATAAQQWMDGGFDIQSAATWIRSGVPAPSGVACWRRLGIKDPDELELWTATGVRTPDEAVAWARVGVTRPGDVRVWKEAGAVNGHDAADWARGGATTPGEVLRWRYQGVTASTVGHWRSAGIVDPEELPAWFEAGITNPAARAFWFRAGVGHPGQIERWKAVGVNTGEEASRWVRPRLITAPEEIQAWRDAGVADPDHARFLIQRSREPASVAHLRAVALSRLRFLPDGTDGRVLTRIPRGGDLVTEIYWYAYDYCCVPSMATHWYAVDFAGGDEVRDSRRSGLVQQPAVETAGGVVSYILAAVEPGVRGAIAL